MAPSALVRQSAAWRQQPAANGAWSKVCLSEIGCPRVSPADNPKWTWLQNRSKRAGHSEGAKAHALEMSDVKTRNLTTNCWIDLATAQLLPSSMGPLNPEALSSSQPGYTLSETVKIWLLISDSVLDIILVINFLYYIYTYIYILHKISTYNMYIMLYLYIHVSYTYSQDRYDPSRSTYPMACEISH